MYWAGATGRRAGRSPLHAHLSLPTQGWEPALTSYPEITGKDTALHGYQETRLCPWFTLSIYHKCKEPGALGLLVLLKVCLVPVPPEKFSLSIL